MIPLPLALSMGDLRTSYEALLKCLEACKIANQTIKDHAPPKKPEHIQSDNEWQAYRMALNDYNNQEKSLQEASKALDDEYSRLRRGVLTAIPYKGVWFRLPGTDNWLVKTSNNTMDKDGTNLHEFETDDFTKLPKLTTL